MLGLLFLIDTRACSIILRLHSVTCRHPLGLWHCCGHKGLVLQVTADPVISEQQELQESAAQEESRKFAALTIKSGREVSIDAENVPSKADTKTPSFGCGLLRVFLAPVICLMWLHGGYFSCKGNIYIMCGPPKHAAKIWSRWGELLVFQAA